MKRYAERFGPWAIVTGASSGLGVEFARQLAAAGVHCVLVARREDRLQELAAELATAYSVETRVAALDLARDDFLPALREVTEDLEIGLLVNNAGFATSGNFLDNDFADELNMFHLNCRAPLMLAHEFGPAMQERGRGGIIFVASLVAFAGVPRWSNYAATKAFNLTFAEGLSKELRPRGVAVLAIAPGTIRTDFWAPAGGAPPLSLTAAGVARVALRRLGGPHSIVVGLMNRLIAFSTRLLPRTANATIFGWVIKLAQRRRAGS